MDKDTQTAYEWAKKQDFTSVAARYAKMLASEVDRLTAALRECAERREGCEYCETPGKTLHVVECAEPRIMLHVSGRYVQMYDEEYPGWVDNFPIHFCPMCGRKLERSDT